MKILRLVSRIYQGFTKIYLKVILFGSNFLKKTSFSLFIESETSRGVSWWPNSSHKLVNAFSVSETKETFFLFFSNL